MRFTASHVLGLARSLLIYYGRPFRVRQLARFYTPFISPGDLCFDIGAHVGTHIHAFRRLGARVIGIEPQPLFVAFLTALFRGQKDVVLIEQALGSSAGEGVLQLSNRTPTVSSLSEDWIAAVDDTPGFKHVTWNERVPVLVGTLDDLIRSFGLPAFCKIDVEGSEIAVIRGLSQPIQALSFEYMSAAVHLAQECVQYLSSLSQYEYNAAVGEQMQLRFRRWLPPADISDWLANQAAQGRSGDVIARLKLPHDGAP